MEKVLVDIGNAKLEAIRSGEQGPIIMIETGMGVSAYDWLEIISALDKIATIIVYHRCGYGDSTNFNEGGRSIDDNVDDLYRLIQHMNIKEPVILAAHSFGGFCAQQFAIRYPEAVKGMVLIDASPTDYSGIEQLKSRLPVIDERYNSNRVLQRWLDLSHKTELELKVLMEPRLTPVQEGFSEELQKSILAFGINPKLYEAMISELDIMRKSKLPVDRMGRFPQIPLKVFVRDQEIEIKKLVDVGVPYEEARQLENLVQELIRQQTALSRKSNLIEAKGCGHAIYKENADLVISAILELIEETFTQ